MPTFPYISCQKLISNKPRFGSELLKKLQITPKKSSCSSKDSIKTWICKKKCNKLLSIITIRIPTSILNDAHHVKSTSMTADQPGEKTTNKKINHLTSGTSNFLQFFIPLMIDPFKLVSSFIVLVLTQTQRKFYSFEIQFIQVYLLIFYLQYHYISFESVAYNTSVTCLCPTYPVII